MVNHFETREDASIAAAERIVEATSRRLGSHREASIVVSGGRSPAHCFEALAASSIEWQRVHVVLSDERWVPPDHDDSNEKLVRETLLTERAASARLQPVYRDGVTRAAHCAELNERLRQLPFPFACVLLGMGEDGHFASLFPDFDELDIALDVDTQQLCVPVETVTSPYPRVSLTLAAFSRSDEILLLVFGDAKREVVEQAKASSDAYPVSKLFWQKRAPVRVFWAP